MIGGLGEAHQHKCMELDAGGHVHGECPRQEYLLLCLHGGLSSSKVICCQVFPVVSIGFGTTLFSR